MGGGGTPHILCAGYVPQERTPPPPPHFQACKSVLVHIISGKIKIFYFQYIKISNGKQILHF